MTSSPLTREQILDQLRSLGPMAYGTLTPVYRRGSDQPTYFKLQVWKDGKNHTRHVKARELADLQERIGNRVQAEDLFRHFLNLAVEGSSSTGSTAKKKMK